MADEYIRHAVHFSITFPSSFFVESRRCFMSLMRIAVCMPFVLFPVFDVFAFVFRVYTLLHESWWRPIQAAFLWVSALKRNEECKNRPENTHILFVLIYHCLSKILFISLIFFFLLLILRFDCVHVMCQAAATTKYLEWIHKIIISMRVSAVSPFVHVKKEILLTWWITMRNSFLLCMFNYFALIKFKLLFASASVTMHMCVYRWRRPMRTTSSSMLTSS